MSAEAVLTRLQRFLLSLAGFILAGAVVELYFTEHYEKTLQLVPFALCAVGLLVVGAALFRPQRNTLMALRVVMIFVAAGSLLGLILHLNGNYQFELEIRPNAEFGEAILATLRGANPLLAPGVLGIAATLAIASTYHHPALGKES